MASQKQEVLDSLRANVEGGRDIWPDGSDWREVYLDNARPKGMGLHVFAGYLSALERDGVYRSYGDDCFGKVRMAG